MFILLGCHGPSLKCQIIHDIDGDKWRKCSPAKIVTTSSKLLNVPPVKAFFFVFVLNNSTCQSYRQKLRSFVLFLFARNHESATPKEAIPTLLGETSLSFILHINVWGTRFRYTHKQILIHSLSPLCQNKSLKLEMLNSTICYHTNAYYLSTSSGLVVKAWGEVKPLSFDFYISNLCLDF